MIDLGADAGDPGARAAQKFGTIYSLSTLGTTTIEDIAAVTDGPKMYQVYVFKDRGITKDFIQRCKDSNYDAICLTVDTQIHQQQGRPKHWVWRKSDTSN